MTVLKVNDIRKSFGAVEAVKGVSFEVGEGEIFGLLGMNGAGKSTVINICTGLLRPDGGSAEVLGKDVASGKDATRYVNLSPQETAVAPLLSVRENLSLVARMYGAERRTALGRADVMIERLRLAEKAGARAGKLSGGLMRRLSIGMALITEPKLVFLDEPTLGLDVVARRELWKIVREAAKRAAVVLTTHYLGEAEALCDRIAVMKEGKLVAVGSAEELKAAAGEDTFENAFLRLCGEEGYIDER